LSDDKTFTVRADKLSDKNKYVKSIKFNDKEVNENFITYQQIMNGGMLVFEMTDRE
jgi:putative alpha-1,2-mannosidase